MKNRRIGSFLSVLICAFTGLSICQDKSSDAKISTQDAISYHNLGNNKLYIKLKNSISNDEKETVLKKLKTIAKDVKSICEDKYLLSNIVVLKDEQNSNANNKSKFFKETYGVECEKEFVLSYESEIAVDIEDLKSPTLTGKVKKLDEIAGKNEDIGSIYHKERKQYLNKIEKDEVIKNGIEFAGRAFFKISAIPDTPLHKDKKFEVKGIKLSFLPYVGKESIDRVNNILAKKYDLKITEETKKKLDELVKQTKSGLRLKNGGDWFPEDYTYEIVSSADSKKEGLSQIMEKIIKDEELSDYLYAVGASVEFKSNSQRDCELEEKLSEILRKTFRIIDVESPKSDNQQEVKRRWCRKCNSK